MNTNNNNLDTQIDGLNDNIIKLKEKIQDEINDNNLNDNNNISEYDKLQQKYKNLKKNHEELITEHDKIKNEKIKNDKK